MAACMCTTVTVVCIIKARSFYLPRELLPYHTAEHRQINFEAASRPILPGGEDEWKFKNLMYGSVCCEYSVCMNQQQFQLLRLWRQHKDAH